MIWNHCCCLDTHNLSHTHTLLLRAVFLACSKLLFFFGNKLHLSAEMLKTLLSPCRGFVCFTLNKFMVRVHKFKKNRGACISYFFSCLVPWPNVLWEGIRVPLWVRFSNLALQSGRGTSGPLYTPWWSYKSFRTPLSPHEDSCDYYSRSSSGGIGSLKLVLSLSVSNTYLCVFFVYVFVFLVYTM